MKSLSEKSKTQALPINILRDQPEEVFQALTLISSSSLDLTCLHSPLKPISLPKSPFSRQQRQKSCRCKPWKDPR